MASAANKPTMVPPTISPKFPLASFGVEANAEVAQHIKIIAKIAFFIIKLTDFV